MALLACGSNSGVVQSPRYRAGGGGGNANDAFAQQEGRVVIFNANLTMKVENADTFNLRLTDIARRYEGYVVKLGSESSTFRVKAQHLNDALTALKGQGKVISKTVSGNDVTEIYHDHEIRLENLEKSRQRYLELLARAENVEAALRVEKELERVNGEMDSLKGKLQSMKHLADFSTITIVSFYITYYSSIRNCTKVKNIFRYRFCSISYLDFTSYGCTFCSRNIIIIIIIKFNFSNWCISSSFVY